MLASLHESGFSNTDSVSALTGSDEPELFLSILGSIMSRGSSEEKQKLRQELQQYQCGRSISGRIRRPQETTRSTASATRSTIHQDNSLMEAEHADPDLPRYTAKLKEAGDKVGFVPRYRFEEMSGDSPAFRSVLAFRDRVFEGTGSSMKRAKHEASKKACRSLGVKIR